MSEPTVTLDAGAIATLAEALAATVPVPGGLLDAQQAARLLNVPPSWLLAEARADRVPHVRLGRYVRFDHDDLREWWTTSKSRGPRRNGHGA